MQKFLPVLAAAAMAMSSAAFAQTTTPSPSTTPSSPPAASPTSPSGGSTSPSGAVEVKPPMSTTQDATSPSAAPKSSAMLTDEQAKAWINKVVYSSDDKNLGEVAAFKRDTAGNVTELHADIGGFLGLGETRVRLMPSEFKFVNDRVVLNNITAEQAKTLPKIAK